MKKDDSNLFQLTKKVEEEDKLPVRLKERDSLDLIKWNQTNKNKITSTSLFMYNAECNKLMSIK